LPKIDNAIFGSIIIDGKKYTTDVIVFWDGEVMERIRTHTFSKNELIDILMKEPDIVIVGTGMAGNMKVDPAAEVYARLQGVELISKTTREAIQEFNKLSRRKKVVAVMHVTD